MCVHRACGDDRYLFSNLITSLPLGLFDQERILVSTEELFALYRAIGQASRPSWPIWGTF